MLGGKPLFKGRDYVDQLNQILQILGTPDEATLRRVGSERVSHLFLVLVLRHIGRVKDTDSNAILELDSEVQASERYEKRFCICLFLLWLILARTANAQTHRRLCAKGRSNCQKGPDD
jgi:hypothetical protein